MKIATSFLAGLFWVGSVGASATAVASEDGVLLKEELGSSCHMKFRAIEPHFGLGQSDPQERELR
jgi:hypothetical protein